MRFVDFSGKVVIGISEEKQRITLSCLSFFEATWHLFSAAQRLVSFLKQFFGVICLFNGLVSHFNDFSIVDNFLLQITVIFRISIDRTKIMTTKSSTSSVAPLGVRKVERPRPLRSLSHVGHQTNVNLANAATNRRLSAQDVSTGKYLSGKVNKTFQNRQNAVILRIFTLILDFYQLLFKLLLFLFDLR